MKKLVSTNPATGEVIWEGATADASAVDQAVTRAHAAFPQWSNTPVEERIRIVDAFAGLLKERAHDMAILIARETGKVVWDAKSEVQAMIGKAAISVRAYQERTGQHAAEAGGKLSVIRHRPHGVLAVFGPYNFPGHLPNGHIMPALIAGNTIVLKPSEYTPAVAEYMYTLWQQASLPEGVLNVVQGGRDTGVALATHTGLQGLLFTGSAEVGQTLHKQFAGRPEFMLALEMGGNNPLIVWEPQDMRATIFTTLQSAFITTGQRCTCARRLIVPDNAVGAGFVGALAEAAATLKIGAYTDTPEPYMGPLIGNREAEKLLDAEKKLLAQGGRSVLPMRRLVPDRPFVTPAIIDVTAIKVHEDKEYFGPLLQVTRVPDFDAAIAEANATHYGLAAGLISDSRALYEQFIARIRAGIVNWNQQTTGASSALPFGGIGISGNHRPSAYYAADYCAYPMASQEAPAVNVPEALPPGMPL